MKFHRPVFIAALCIVASICLAPKAVERIRKAVRHELVTLPFLSAFDNLGYQVNGYNVTLVGQVTKPTLKSDAESAVKKIEGVEKVDNQIEVLPLSPIDDGLRRRACLRRH